MASRIRCV